jgi:cardiolipin synthase
LRAEDSRVDGVTSATALVPLWNRAAEWARRLTMIREARSFLYLSTYYIEYDTYGIELLTALDEAQRRGVAVNLLIDGFGQRLGGTLMSPAAKAALAERLDALRAGGAIVTVYRPPRRVQRWLGGGHHVKIQVSEAGEAIFGSSNITRSSFEGWNEYSVALRGPVVRALLESYRHIGGSVVDAHLSELEALGDEGEAGVALNYWLCNPNDWQGARGPLGWHGPNVVTDRLIEMIAGAERSVWITSFYFKPVEPLVTALLDAAARGVRIEVHHSHRDALASTDLAWIAAAELYDRLLGAGVDVYENVGGEHSKIVVIDRAWAALGSYNFEDAAHDRLAEAMLAGRDPRIVDPAVAIFETLRRQPNNIRVTADSLRALPLALKAKRAIFGRFKRWT